MTARDEVLDLLAGYCRAVDDRELDKLWRLFDADCEYTFVDGAIAHGADEIREMLGGRIAGAIRHRHILTNTILEIDGDTARAKSDWYLIKPAAGERIGRGVALGAPFGSFICVILETEVTPAGEIRMRRAVAAVDCGIVINPNTIEAQVQGGLVFVSMEHGSSPVIDLIALHNARL